jgi:Sulfotransferase family
VTADPPIIIFLHLPKACGTTLTKLLMRWFTPGEVFAVDRRKPAEIRSALEKRARQKSPRLRLIVGHAAFGLHETLDRPVQYITVLREPVQRLLSNYRYVQRTREHRLHAEVSSGALTLKEFAARFSDLQTRYLGGAPNVRPDADTLARAKENLRRYFAVAGVADRFDESALLIHRAFGRKLRGFSSENVGGSERSAHALDASERCALHAASELDADLWSFAQRRFDALVAAQDESLTAELARLRRANRRAETIAGVMRRFKPVRWLAR